MDDKEITGLLNNLSRHTSEPENKRAAEKLLTVETDQIPLLIQPGSKDLWENAAALLIKFDFTKIENYIPQLLDWLQDLNWPGAKIIFTYLLSIDKGKIFSHIEKSIRIAADTEDDLWLYNLAYLTRELGVSKTDYSDLRLFNVIENVDE
ncbi:MAG: DUF5071 domain-containing protein [Calditrichales bacterium]|nr:MAG: DUF5071 domain-containing protein [Calditrichales bacterium]